MCIRDSGYTVARWVEVGGLKVPTVFHNIASANALNLYTEITVGEPDGDLGVQVERVGGCDVVEHGRHLEPADLDPPGDRVADSPGIRVAGPDDLDARDLIGVAIDEHEVGEEPRPVLGIERHLDLVQRWLIALARALADEGELDAGRLEQERDEQR